MTIHDNILETIGNTPIIRLGRLAPKGVNVFVKAEAFNPMGSVKDRMAQSVIEAAERDGLLRPGQTVIEATSGNTGIGLAMVCAVKGYPLVLVMPESASVERRKILRFLGAKVVLTPAELKGTGMVEKAIELADEHGWFLTRQFDNAANPEAHVRTTGVEIVEAFKGRRLDYFVSGYGTGGTLQGVARVLREHRPETKIVVAEPDNSALVGSGIAQTWRPDGWPKESHPSFRPHLMQGWVPDFIPKITEEALARGLVDEVVAVDGNKTLANTRALATHEGIFAGISSGATLTAALEVAARAPEGSSILCMLPDTGERYLSTPLFDDISVDMSDEEMAISRSTDGARFDLPKVCPIPTTPVAPPEPTHEAAAFLEETIHDREQPVVLFALEWCEFCWSVRKLFAKLGIEYRSVDLDSVAYQQDDWGGQIRVALHAKTGRRTIPQIFVGGKHIGGATDVFEAYRDGSLKEALDALRVPRTSLPGFVPETLLPGWLQARQ